MATDRELGLYLALLLMGFLLAASLFGHGAGLGPLRSPGWAWILVALCLGGAVWWRRRRPEPA